MRIHLETKKIVFIATVLSLLAVSILYLMGTSAVTTTISLQFEGIEKGVNPDGTRFNYSTIVSEDVVKTVCQVADIEYHPEYLESVSVVPILPSTIMETIKEKRVAGENYTYFPNEFKINITLDSDLMNKDLAMNLAESYASGYSIYFVNEFTYPFLDLDQLISYFDIEDYDFPEYEVLFNSRYDIIYSYLNVLRKDNPEFVSSEGLSFADLREAVALTQRFDLKRLSALIDTYDLSKDEEKLRIKYTYLQELYKRREKTTAENYNVSNELLNVVKDNKQTVMIPSGTGELMAISVLSDNYDKLAKKATDYIVTQSNTGEEIRYINSKLNKLDNPKFSEFQRAQAVKEANESVELLEASINKWIKVITRTAKEYFDLKYEHAVSLVSPAKAVAPLSLTKVVMLFVVVFAVVSGTLFRIFSKEDL